MRSTRDESHAVQAPAVVAAELAEPAVVCVEAGALQVAVGHPEQAHAEARVQHLGVDAVELLVLDALDRVPAARPRGLVALVEQLLELLARTPGREPARDRERRRALRDEEVARALAALVLDHLRRALAEAPVDARLPEVERLGHVRVGGDDTVAGHGGSPLQLTPPRLPAHGSRR
jgi:hypothetical protein